MKKLLILAALVAAPPALADAPFEGYAETYAEVVNHVACFPHGIDMISAGDVEGGMAIWNECWGEDLNRLPGRQLCIPRQSTGSARSRYARSACSDGLSNGEIHRNAPPVRHAESEF
jgi:hypothetical protein